MLQPKCPSSLYSLQSWMGSLIASPFQETLQEPFTEVHCQEYILPSLKLRPHERVHIYHEQYWFRLFSTLQENFPALLRLFGYHSFNFTIALPYFLKFPPSQWSLNDIGFSLPIWVREHYTDFDKELIEFVATMESAIHFSFTAHSYTSLEKSDLATLEHSILQLQPHVFLFHHHAHFFKLRDLLLKQPVEYWQSHPLPELEVKETYTLLFRNVSNQICWKSISLQDYQILKKIKDGSSLSEVFEDQIDDSKRLIDSFKDWTEQKLIYKRL